MSNSDAVASEVATLEATSAVPTSSGVVSVPGGLVPDGLVRKLSRGFTLTDRQLALLISATLFVVGAWPLALTPVPPYQDLPNHLAAVTVIQHPELYPEFTFNGYFKTNAALFAWLVVVGKVVGVPLAARLFTLLVLAANALAIPRFVLAMTGSRKKMVLAGFFAWPMIHNWFVSMGMLDFALGVPLSLAVIIALDRHRQKPSIGKGLLVTALGFVTWYAHVFPLLVVLFLTLVHALARPSWKERVSSLKTLGWPLAPVSSLVIVSVAQHLRDNTGSMTTFVRNTKLVAPWELAYNLWAEWFWSFTKLSMSTLVPCILLGVFGFWSMIRRREASPPFFSTIAVCALLVLYCFVPYKVTNWYHVNSRLIPFIFFGLLLRIPEKLPSRLLGVLAVSGVLYSASMGADFLRLERDRERFTAGIQYVPERARLLPLLFSHKGVSDNTRSLLHAWGFYVVEKQTSAPLLFAHSRSFPVMYSTPPPARFNHVILESFPSDMTHAGQICEAIAPIMLDDCNAEYRARWAEFWRDATPRFDHLLLWAAPPQALAEVPPDFTVVYRQGDLVIMKRIDKTAAQ
jgi:hypothetical protein